MPGMQPPDHRPLESGQTGRRAQDRSVGQNVGHLPAQAETENLIPRGTSMILTGIGDEAGNTIDAQIAATKELGWKYIEARGVEVPGFPRANLHDIQDKAFDIVVEKLKENDIGVYCFGSTIMNWAKTVET